MMTADRMLDVLTQYPFPGAADVRSTVHGCHMVIAGRRLIYSAEGWMTGTRTIPATWPAFDSCDDGDRAHSEIRRLLITLDEDRRRDAEQALAKMTDAHSVVSQRLIGSQTEVAEVSAERDEATARATKAEARVKRLRKSINAAHAVLDEAGIGLEVEGSPRWTLARRCRAAAAPVWGYLDALQAFDVVGEIVGVTGKTGERGFIDAVIARVKALRNDDDTRAAIAVAVGLDGSASLGLIFDTVKEVSTSLAWPEADPYPADLIKRANAIRLDAAMHHAGRLFRDEASDARERLAAYLGMDGAGFTEIVVAIERDTSGEPRTGHADLLRLVSYHQAPIKFNARPLTLAERASFVIRRLWQGRTNAANEAAALRRELGDIEAALGDLPDTAEREPIGDREEHLGLSAAERIRLAFTH